MGMRKDPENEWGFERKPSHRAAALLEEMKANFLTPSSPKRSLKF